MTHETQDRLCKAIHTTLRKYVGRDLIFTTERIMDAVEWLWDMESEEVGIASVPEAMREQPWDLHRNAPAEPARVERPPLPKGAIVPASTAPSKGTIIVPGDPEFKVPREKIKEALDTAPRSNIGHGIVRSVGIKRRERPGANLTEAQYWDYTDLNDVIMKNTPVEVEFQTEGPTGPITLKAVRNTKCQIGLGNVILSYKHPSMADDTENHSAGGRVVWSLAAQESFSLYQKEFNFNEVLEKIMDQLRGLYRARPDSMEPQSGPEPGPLRLDMRTQAGESYSDNFEVGAGLVEDPSGTVQRRVTQSNNSLAPPGRRF